jgi:predicted esterase
MTPYEVRSMCSRADVETTLQELRRERIGATDLRKVLGSRESHGKWAAWTGTVELSDEHGRGTDMAVHVPPPGQRQLGALIVLHGAGGDGDEILPYFSAFGDRLGMAVVCPTAQSPPSAPNGLAFAGIFGKRFGMPCWDLQGPDFPLAALRWARAELDVDPDRCALVGLSMGGLATWNLSMRFWHLFAAAVPINGALSMWESFGTDRRTRALLPNTLPLPMFVVHGSEDVLIPPRFDRESVATLRDLGHEDVEYVEVPGGEHALPTLRMGEGTPLFHRLERWLGSKRRRPRPVEVHHHAIDDGHGRAHWVSISGIKPPEIAWVRACRVASDRIDIEVRGATHVTLHLTSEWFMPGESVEVSVNGAIARFPFEPDVATVVETFRETADPELVAEQVVSLAVQGPPSRQHPGTSEG